MFAPLGLRAGAPGRAGRARGRGAVPHLRRERAGQGAQRRAAQRLPALADDAGLCVDAFGGLPGVDTAYYATQFGYPKGDDNNVKALLEQMRGIDNRRAALVSTLVAVRTRRSRAADRRRPRRRRDHARAGGEHGFGFDPVMFIPAFGKTFAQLPPEVKNANSHRGQAARQMVQLIRERWL
jgi:XTP/dITP diphosphohydrolase